MFLDQLGSSTERSANCLINMLDKNLKWAPPDPEDVLSDELFTQNIDDGNEQMESEQVDEEINSMHDDIDDLKVEGECEPDKGYEQFDHFLWILLSKQEAHDLALKFSQNQGNLESYNIRL